MAKKSFEEELDGFKNQQEKIKAIQDSMGDSLKSSYNTLFDIRKLYTNILSINEKIEQNKKKANKLDDEAKKLNAQLSNIDSEENDKLLKQIILLEERRDSLKKEIPIQEKLASQYKTQADLIKDSAVSFGGLKMFGKAALGEITKGLKTNFAWFNEQDKVVRQAGLSMGILSSQAKAFSNNLYKASIQSNAIGVSAKDLAIYQKDYSEGIGRAVELSGDELNAIGEIAKGTTLGADGANELVTAMDQFGISAGRSRDLIEETVNKAHSMGLDASKTSKLFLENLKTAQKFNLKGGIKDVEAMTTMGAKFKLTMQDVSGFAEKLWTPEGAIESAAKLQVLGGEWAKMGDTFKLMYQGRNDMKGLIESVKNATKGVYEFNKEKGEFDASSENLQKLKLVADATGISFDELNATAKATAKDLNIKAQITGIKPTDPGYEFISSLATFTKDGKAQVKFGDMTVPTDLANLNSTQLLMANNLAKEQATLKDRAKDTQSLDQAWENLKNTLKSTLLPAFNDFVIGMKPALEGFTKFMQDNGPKIADAFKGFGSIVGTLAGAIGKFIVENPLLGIGALGLFEVAKWTANGLALGLGFKMATGGLKGVLGGFSKLGGGEKGSVLKGAGIAGGLGLAGELGGMGLDYLNTKNKESGSYKAGSSSDKWMSAGSGALKGAGTGAMIGSFLGPEGTAVGAGAGALIGGGIGYMSTEPEQQDFVSRPGQKAVPFSSSDTLLSMKDGGPMQKSFQDMGKGNSVGGDMKISFDAIKVEFSPLELKYNGSSSKIDISDPILIREVAGLVQQELRKNLGGGKLNNKPIA